MKNIINYIALFTIFIPVFAQAGFIDWCKEHKWGLGCMFIGTVIVLKYCSYNQKTTKSPSSSASKKSQPKLTRKLSVSVETTTTNVALNTTQASEEQQLSDREKWRKDQEYKLKENQKRLDAEVERVQVLEKKVTALEKKFYQRYRPPS